ncbi:MAG: hypothetical protein WC443_14660 [Desulfobaccales bacterium]
MTFKGEAAIRMEDGRLAVVVLPERGGKIASIRDLRLNRELLWQYEGATYPEIDPIGSFSAADSSGFDDMFPAILPGSYGSKPWPDLMIPDHGEAWRLPWSLLSATPAAASLELQGRIFPYSLRKDLRLCADCEGRPTLRIDYALENTGSSEFEWIWAAHPLFDMGPKGGFRLKLSEGVRAGELRLINAYDSTALPGYGMEYPFPEGAGILPVDRLPPEDRPLALKYWFLQPSCCVGAEMWTGDAEYHLQIAWDTQRLPYLGVWINGGGWAGQRNLALEPASAPMDGFTQARKAGFQLPRLQAGAVATWFFSIALPV